MCTGDTNTNLRRIGTSEQAARKGDMSEYDKLGGREGDLYRDRLRRLGPEFDPLAKLGLFATQDIKGTGPADLRNAGKQFPDSPKQAGNPFYTTVISQRPAPVKTSTSYANGYVPKVK